MTTCRTGRDRRWCKASADIRRDPKAQEKIISRKLKAALVAVVVVGLAGPASASAQDPVSTVPQVAPVVPPPVAVVPLVPRPVIIPCVVTQEQHARYAKKVYSRAMSRESRERLRKMRGCAKSVKAQRNMRSMERQLKRLMYWVREFDRLSAADKRWARVIGSCESGNNPRTNTGNGFLGAMQWVLSTWHEAGGSGSPTSASLYEQYVRAVRWRNRTSTMQWPKCSRDHGFA